MTHQAKLIGILPLISIVIAVLIYTFLPDREPKPQAITADETSYASLKDLTAASDLIVIAKATETKTGRLISSWSDSTTSVRTELVTLKVGQILKGSTGESIVLEQEKSIGDKTPIVVNDVQPTKVNDEGLFFLQQSKDEAAPYVALINRQGRYLVSGPDRDQLTAATGDTLSTQLATLGPFEMRCQVLAAAAPTQTKAEC